MTTTTEFQKPSKLGLVKTIFIIALPITLQNLAFYFQIFINTAFIGHYRVDGLSAINNAMVPFFMLFSFFFALSQGTTVFIAQSIGAKDHAKAGKIAECSLLYNHLISLGYCIFWVFAGPLVLGAMGVTGSVYTLGADYIRILSLIYLTAGLSITSASVYQGVGNTTPIMINTFVKVGLNILLDWLLIFGKGGFPELGVSGAAWATVISSTITNIWLFASLKKNGTLGLTLQGILKPVKGLYKPVISFGIKAGGEFMLWTGAQVAMVRMLNHFDIMGAGVYGIFNTLIGLSFNLYIGIGIAATTIVGRATGAKDYHYAFYAGNLCAAISLLLCSVVGALYLAFPAPLTSLFTSDTSIKSQLLPLVVIVVFISFPKSINVVIGNAIRGTGDARWMLQTQVAGTAIILMVTAYLLWGRHLGVAALVWANFFDELWRACVNYLRFYFAGRGKMVK